MVGGTVGADTSRAMPIFEPSRGWTATLASYRKGRATGLRKWNKEARERPAWAAPFAFDTLPVNLPAVTGPAPLSTCNDRRSFHATRGARCTALRRNISTHDAPTYYETAGACRDDADVHARRAPIRLEKARTDHHQGPPTKEQSATKGARQGSQVGPRTGSERPPLPEATSALTGPSVCSGHWHRCKTAPLTVRHFRAYFPQETRATPGHGATTPDK